MKQKILIKVSKTDLKSRSKAMKIAVSVSGVESAAISGNEMDHVEVVGDGIDAVGLTRLLRKNVAHAELVSVDEVKKEEAKPGPGPAPAPEPGPAPQPQPPQVVWNWSYVPHPYYYTPYGQNYPDPFCTIL